MQQASQVILRSYERLSHVYEESKGKSNKAKKEATGEREIFKEKTNFEVFFFFFHSMGLSFQWQNSLLSTFLIENRLSLVDSCKLWLYSPQPCKTYNRDNKHKQYSFVFIFMIYS